MDHVVDRRYVFSVIWKYGREGTIPFHGHDGIDAWLPLVLVRVVELRKVR